MLVFAILVVVLHRGHCSSDTRNGYLLPTSKEYDGIMNLTSTIYGSSRCSGVIVNSNWLLTSAHCKIKIGDQVRAGRYEGRGAPDSRVTSFTQHPKFVRKSLAYDIAVVGVDPPLKASHQLGFLGSSEISSGKQVFAAGFGRCHELSNKTLAIKTRRMSNCDFLVRRRMLKSDLYKYVICTRGGQPSCPGDSGGPLLVSGTVEGTYVLIGVHKKKYNLSSPRIVGTGVAHHLGWINRTTGGGVRLADTRT